jgi:oligoendopeptidase F
MAISERWDLESIFPGGSSSAEYVRFVAKLAADLAEHGKQPLPQPLSDQNRTAWVGYIQNLYDLSVRQHQARAFVNALLSQNVKDEAAFQHMTYVDQLAAQLESCWTQFSAACSGQEDGQWQALMRTPELALVAFHLSEERAIAGQKMASELESLATELAADGYHAWNRLYRMVSGEEQVTLDGQSLSLGQLQNKYEDDADREVRRRAFELYETTWNRLAKSCAMSLNYQAGFRLTLYRRRGWDTVRHEPLLNNRLTAETLDTMWQIIDEKSGRLLDYFAAKARLLGLEKLDWFDLWAPVGQESQEFSYTSAANFVVENIRQFNPDLADFCRMAIDRRWVESEYRPGKRAGAFCTTFPLSRQPRVFMTFNGSYSGMLTLAHELGHAYHAWVMRDLPYGARQYTMSVAETASTFNELIVSNANLQDVNDSRERLSMLANKLNDAATYLMNIRARYDFERAYFERRAKRQLSVAELCELMENAQKQAYKEGLAGYHPYFWASKLHFYNTGAPFYNFPYTFGYLFSHGVYAQAIAEGSAFQERYVALLRDTGSMTTEQLAKAHLGVDLTRPEFWETALDQVLSLIPDFVALVDQMVQP